MLNITKDILLIKKQITYIYVLRYMEVLNYNN